MKSRMQRLFSFSYAVALVLLGALSACSSTESRELSYTYKEILSFGDLNDTSASLVDNWSNQAAQPPTRAPAANTVAPAAVPTSPPRKAAMLVLKAGCAVHATTDDKSKIFSRLKAKTKLWITPSSHAQWGIVSRKSGPAYMRYNCFN